MPECGNCGGHVTPAYVRVHAPTEADTVRTCPNCNLVRDGAQIRDPAHVALAAEDEILADGRGDETPHWTEGDE